MSWARAVSPSLPSQGTRGHNLTNFSIFSPREPQVWYQMQRFFQRFPGVSSLQHVNGQPFCRVARQEMVHALRFSDLAPLEPFFPFSSFISAPVIPTCCFTAPPVHPAVQIPSPSPFIRVPGLNVPSATPRDEGGWRSRAMFQYFTSPLTIITCPRRAQLRAVVPESHFCFLGHFFL